MLTNLNFKVFMFDGFTIKCYHIENHSFWDYNQILLQHWGLWQNTCILVLFMWIKLKLITKANENSSNGVRKAKFITDQLFLCQQLNNLLYLELIIPVNYNYKNIHGYVQNFSRTIMQPNKELQWLKKKIKMGKLLILSHRKRITEIYRFPSTPLIIYEGESVWLEKTDLSEGYLAILSA